MRVPEFIQDRSTGRRVVLAILQAKGQLPQQQHMQNETNAPDIAAWETGSNGPKKKRSSSKMCTLIGKMMNHSISGIFQLLDKARKVGRKIERQLEILELAMELMAPLN
jgi:hypothetical protein